MHVIGSMQGPVLVAGDFNTELLEYMSQFCQVHSVLNSLDKSSQKPSQDNSIRYLSLDESLGMKFNAIIIDAYRSNASINSQLVTHFYDECLEKGGTVCYLEKNSYALKHRPGNVIYKIFSAVFESRAVLTRENHFFNAIRLSTICYDREPHESFVDGVYSSNKNIFLLKEKVRRSLLRSRFSRLFVPANVWLLAGDASSQFLHNQIIEQYARLCTLDVSDFQLTNIFYNKGKLLFIFRNNKSLGESVVAVLAYEENSCRQRINEQKIISHLRSYSTISKYLPKNYYKFSLFGYDVFIMQEYQGITVDASSRYLAEMTENIGRVLLEISLVSHKNISVRPEPIEWLNTIQGRIPGYNEQISVLKKFVSDYSCGVSVVMHGDAKIENFVLNKQNHVVGIIDWEQGIVNGFPLLDLYYLFAYNYQLNNNTDFSHAFRALAESAIPAYEQAIHDNYCNEMQLNDKDKIYLLIVFFIHHYSCRYDVGPDTGSVWDVFKSSLATALELVRKQSNG